jgi:hypothetical protein
MGCAPIPGGGSSGSQGYSRPAGKWEARWGAIVEDMSPNPEGPFGTGVSVSKKSKKDAIAVATKGCQMQGGNNCKLRIAYHNQCIALVDPIPVNGNIPVGMISSAVGAPTLEEAKERALKECIGGSQGAPCSVVYAACSMSEYREF